MMTLKFGLSEFSRVHLIKRFDSPLPTMAFVGGISFILYAILCILLLPC